jgi:hypothetical protein
MKKSLFGFGAICCVSALALLAGCQKNGECCGNCKETAAVAKDGEVTPASAKTGTCASSCSKTCTEAKASECPMSKQQN